MLYIALGLGKVEEFPLPKFQLHEVAPPVDISVKLTGSGAQPVTGEPEKFAVSCAKEETAKSHPPATNTIRSRAGKPKAKTKNL